MDFFNFHGSKLTMTCSSFSLTLYGVQTHFSTCHGSFTLPDSGSDSDSDSQCSHWDWDPSLDLCNENTQHITIVAKGKSL